MLGLALMGGLIFGVGFGVLREISDTVFRTTAQNQERLHAEFCGATGGGPYPFPNGQLSPNDGSFVGMSKP